MIVAYSHRKPKNEKKKEIRSPHSTIFSIVKKNINYF